jgi:hypothetical protein
MAADSRINGVSGWPAPVRADVTHPRGRATRGRRGLSWPGDYRITWSVEDAGYLATCLEVPSLSSRPYSGEFNRRVDEQLHRRHHGRRRRTPKPQPVRRQPTQQRILRPTAGATTSSVVHGGASVATQALPANSQQAALWRCVDVKRGRGRGRAGEMPSRTDKWIARWCGADDSGWGAGSTLT